MSGPLPKSCIFLVFLIVFFKKYFFTRTGGQFSRFWRCPIEAPLELEADLQKLGLGPQGEILDRLHFRKVSFSLRGVRVFWARVIWGMLLQDGPVKKLAFYPHRGSVFLHAESGLPENLHFPLCF